MKSPPGIVSAELGIVEDCAEEAKQDLAEVRCVTASRSLELRVRCVVEETAEHLHRGGSLVQYPLRHPARMSDVRSDELLPSVLRKRLEDLVRRSVAPLHVGFQQDRARFRNSCRTCEELDLVHLKGGIPFHFHREPCSCVAAVVHAVVDEPRVPSDRRAESRRV
ncbi:MAG TPA: hypothetical protein PJ992_00715 [Arachnia sp.]|nr:hypothetical protein [Arachnia sp.]